MLFLEMIPQAQTTAAKAVLHDLSATGMPGKCQRHLSTVMQIDVQLLQVGCEECCQQVSLSHRTAADQGPLLQGGPACCRWSGMGPSQFWRTGRRPCFR